MSRTFEKKTFTQKQYVINVKIFPALNATGSCKELPAGAHIYLSS